MSDLSANMRCHLSPCRCGVTTSRMGTSFPAIGRRGIAASSRARGCGPWRTVKMPVAGPPTPGAVGGIDHAIPGRIEQRHLVALIDHAEGRAETAAPGTIAAGVRAEFVVLDEEREALFGDFHTRATDTASHVDFPDVR